MFNDESQITDEDTNCFYYGKRPAKINDMYVETYGGDSLDVRVYFDNAHTWELDDGESYKVDWTLEKVDDNGVDSLIDEGSRSFTNEDSLWDFHHKWSGDERYKCVNGEIIPMDWVDNGYPDCEDNSDETGTGTNLPPEWNLETDKE